MIPVFLIPYLPVLKKLLTKILPFLLPFILLAGCYFYGKADGKRYIKGRYLAKIEVMQKAANDEVARLNERAANAAQSYIAEKLDDETKLADYKKRYDDERKKLSAYTLCRVGPEFMRYYEAIGNTATNQKKVRQ